MTLVKKRVTRKALELPLLASLAEMGGSVVPDVPLYMLVAHKVGISILDNEYDITHARPKWIYELQWVRHNLVKQEQIDGSQRGIWRITQKGLDRLALEVPEAVSRIVPPGRMKNERSLKEQLDSCIEQFYKSRIERLGQIGLRDLLSLIDPYVLLLETQLPAQELIDKWMQHFFEIIEGRNSSSLIFAPLMLGFTGQALDNLIPYATSSGQEFWQELTGDPDFYLKLIRLMDKLPEAHRDSYEEEWSKASNRFTKEFLDKFSTPDGSIDWEKLVEFNSGSKTAGASKNDS
ncbi:MAG: PmeII family type II restriction endonuclease [Armatimonadetes bacterium]|nr:PmeII family type II restriction endonuclease [Armatimonadota bacterium]